MRTTRKLVAISMSAIMAASMGMVAFATDSTEASADKEWHVAYLAKNVVDAFAVKMNNEAGKDLDAMVDEALIADWQMYDAQTDPSLQVSVFNDAINNGANAILLQPCEAAGSDPC